MCGRYHFNINNKDLDSIRQKTKQLKLTFKQGEIFPSDNVLCLLNKGSRLDLDVKKWGIKNKKLQINARKESLDNIYYQNMINNRCALFCDGFYEWDKNKQKYLITFGERLYLAAIYNNENELLILTEDSDEEFKNIHHRQPILFNYQEAINYLNNNTIEHLSKKFNIKPLNEEIKLF